MSARFVCAASALDPAPQSTNLSPPTVRLLVLFYLVAWGASGACWEMSADPPSPPFLVGAGGGEGSMCPLCSSLLLSSMRPLHCPRHRGGNAHIWDGWGKSRAGARDGVYSPFDRLAPHLLLLSPFRHPHPLPRPTACVHCSKQTQAGRGHAAHGALGPRNVGQTIPKPGRVLYAAQQQHQQPHFQPQSRHKGETHADEVEGGPHAASGGEGHTQLPCRAHEESAGAQGHGIAQCKEKTKLRPMRNGHHRQHREHEPQEAADGKALQAEEGRGW